MQHWHAAGRPPRAPHMPPFPRPTHVARTHRPCCPARRCLKCTDPGCLSCWDPHTCKACGPGWVLVDNNRCIRVLPP